MFLRTLLPTSSSSSASLAASRLVGGRWFSSGGGARRGIFGEIVDKVKQEWKKESDAQEALKKMRESEAAKIAKEAQERAKELSEKAKEQAAEAAKKASEKVAPVAERVWEKAKVVAETEAFKKATSTAAEVGKKIADSPLGQKAATMADKLTSDTDRDEQARKYAKAREEQGKIRPEDLDRETKHMTVFIREKTTWEKMSERLQESSNPLAKSFVKTSRAISRISDKVADKLFAETEQAEVVRCGLS